MSCTHIGRGLSAVTEKVMRMRDDGKFSTDAAVKLIQAAKAAVHFCDGYEFETVSGIRENYCGICLKRMKSGSRMYNYLDINDKRWNVQKAYLRAPIIAGDFLCKDCFDQMMNEVLEDSEAGPKERIQIESQRRHFIVTERENKVNDTE